MDQEKLKKLQAQSAQNRIGDNSQACSRRDDTNRFQGTNLNSNTYDFPEL